MSIITVVRSIRGKLHSHFAHNNNGICSKQPSTSQNDLSVSTTSYSPQVSTDPPAATTSTPLAAKQSLDSFYSDSSSIASTHLSISSHNHHRRHVKRSLPEPSSSSSDDDLSINEVRQAELIHKDRHRRRKASRPTRSKKQLGIPVSSIPPSSFTVAVVEPPPTSSLSAGISLPHFQTTLKVDPSWSLVDKLIQVKLAAYVSELYPGDNYDESDSTEVSDEELICAVVGIGYGVPSLFEELEKATGLDANTASKRLERIVNRVIQEEDESDDTDNDDTAFVLELSR